MYYTKQIGGPDCGAATASIVFGISYSTAFDLVETSKMGTSIEKVFSAAQKLNRDSIFLPIHNDLKNVWWIENLSKKYPIYLALFLKERVEKRGRPREMNHAVALINGKIYDPRKEHEIALDIFCESVEHCLLKAAVVFGKELNTYGKNSSC